MPFKPHPTDPEKLVYVSRKYDLPTKHEWVGLTDEEVDGLWEMAQAWNPPKHFYLLVEAKLKQKNELPKQEAA